jgi:cytochrome b
MYRVTHRAGSRVVTHVGEYELEQWFVATVSHRLAWGKVISQHRRFSVYPSEFIEAIELETSQPSPLPSQ